MTLLQIIFEVGQRRNIFNIEDVEGPWKGRLHFLQVPFCLKMFQERFRIDEWHCRNPGYIASSEYMLRIIPDAVDLPQTSRMSSPSHSKVAPTVKTLNSSLSITNHAKSVKFW